MALLSQSQQPARAGVGMRNGLLCDEALPDEVCYIRSHAVLVSVIAELFKIFARHGTEFPKLSERPNFRRSDGVGPAPKVVCLAGFDTALRFNSRYTFGYQPTIILRVAARSLSPRGVGRVRLTVTGRPLGCSVSGIEGFAGHVFARHANQPPLRGMERLLPPARHEAACRDVRVFCRCL